MIDGDNSNEDEGGDKEPKSFNDPYVLSVVITLGDLKCFPSPSEKGKAAKAKVKPKPRKQEFSLIEAVHEPEAAFRNSDMTDSRHKLEVCWYLRFPMLVVLTISRSF